MENEPIKVFRTSVFGGFDRRDVIDYVKALAAERNDYRKKLDSATAELTALRNELAAAKREAEQAKTSCAAAVGNANAMADEVIARVRDDAAERVQQAWEQAEAARRELRAYKVKAVAEASEQLRALEDGVRTLREHLGGEL